MGEGSQGDRSDTLTGGGYADAGFGDTTARQEKPSHLMDLPNAPDGSFGDTTAKQERPPDVYAVPDVPSKDQAVTIKDNRDNHKKTMQSAVAVDAMPSPDTTVPSTLDDDAPEPEPPKRPRVGPPTLASPGVPQAEWDSAAYPQIANHGGNAPSPGAIPNAVSNFGPAPHAAPPPMGYAPAPHAGGSGNYAHAQPRAPLPPTYRISRREGGTGQVVIILVAVGFCFAIFAAGLLMFVSRRMTPSATTRSTPPTELAPGLSASAAASAVTVAGTTATTPPLQHDNPSPPPATAAPPPPSATAPRATAPAPAKPGKGPKPKGPALSTDR